MASAARVEKKISVAVIERAILDDIILSAIDAARSEDDISDYLVLETGCVLVNRWSFETRIDRSFFRTEIHRADGKAHLDETIPGLTIGDGGKDDVVGHSVVVHAKEDDLKTNPAGNAALTSPASCGCLWTNECSPLSPNVAGASWRHVSQSMQVESTKNAPGTFSGRRWAGLAMLLLSVD